MMRTMDAYLGFLEVNAFQFKWFLQT